MPRCLSIVALVMQTGAAFPDSQSPFAGGPPVPKPDTRSCEVVLYQNEALSAYGQVANATYAGPPADCPAPWSKVLLRFRGSVAGVQFDRAGGLWLDGVELLRTTTPEPDVPGIQWVVEREVTAYAPVFRSASNATLQIPNTVNDQYTGVIYISASLVFWDAPSNAPSQQIGVADAVLPLSSPPSYSNPWSSMSIAGESIRNTTFRFPRSDVINATLDLFASG